MSDEKAEAAATSEAENLIPIQTIEASPADDDGPFIPQVLRDDPIAGDGSASREGVELPAWRVHRLGQDRLVSVANPEGTDRKSRKARRARQASRKARSKRGRVVRGRVRVFVGFLVVVLVAGVAGAGISYVFELWGGKKVPYVVGLSQLNATEQLEEKGFAVSVETVPADTVSGHVVSVVPVEGERAPEGSTVHLVVGQSRTVPEVVGMSREEARSALEAAGAENIQFESRVTTEDEDKVLEVLPGAGSVFMSTEEIVVVVSQLPKMLDVVGQEEDIALLHLEREGISANVQFERSDAEQRLRVVRTEPEAGQTVGEGGANVFVGDPLIDVRRVEDYFDATAAHARDFLQAEGYNPELGYTDYEGHLKARFANDQRVLVSFAREPWLRGVEGDQSGYADVLNDATRIEGVRLTIPAAACATLGIESPMVGESTAKGVMNACGLVGMQGSCTQANIALPRGTTTNGQAFFCCYGESAQHIWTVLVKGATNDGKLAVGDIVVTCAPKSTYAEIDLSGHGSSVCSYVAYQDLYQ